MGSSCCESFCEPYSIGELPAKRSLALVSDMFEAYLDEPQLTKTPG